MRRSVIWAKASPAERLLALKRPQQDASDKTSATARAIIDTVRAKGDDALLAYAQRFDGVDLSSAGLCVGAAALEAAWQRLDDEAQRALGTAAENIRIFHRAQRPQTHTVEVQPGQLCQRLWHPLQRVGCYVPGGSAPLPSALLMSVVPAQIAGCADIVVCTPPDRSGAVPDVIAATAYLLGLKEVFVVGGAQAIAAMAYGTQTVPKVDKLFGPGNAYVTAAKTLCAQDPAGAAIDLPAGPSEVMVVADTSANVDFVAADLLSQAEHGPDSHVVLVAQNKSLAKAVQDAVMEQVKNLSRREIAEAALEHFSTCIYANSQEAIAIANAYAPEHLILQTQDNDAIVEKVRGAGSIFVGPWTPEAVGDYASGTNHVLPTYGFGRAYSGLGVEDFMRATTVQKLTPKALKSLAPTVETLATLEGLDGHKNAVALRRQAIASEEDQESCDGK